MASSREMVMIEECRVSPPSGSLGEKSLPLTFFDLLWLLLFSVRSLFFFKYPHSKTHFIETTIPSLKQSLSIALKHFYPLAGNLLFPPNYGVPEIVYEEGDSISLTFVESDMDFDFLIKNHPREVSHFQPLTPQLKPAWVKEDGSLVAPVFSVQVTLFPNSGVSFGFTRNHVVADGNAFTRFIKFWGTTNKLKDENHEIMPLHEKTIVKDPNNIGSVFWQHLQKIKFEGYRPILPTSSFLATFLLSREEIQKLKKKVMVRCPRLSHVSGFAVTCSYTWVCIVRAHALSGEEVRKDQLEHLCFPVDCRSHLEPPLPENYFGNCVVPCSVRVESFRLMGEDGFVIAANLIGEAIHEKIRSKKGVLMDGLEKIFQRSSSNANIERFLGVTSSPKFGVYDMDFGWGRLQKTQMISIDEGKSISLHEGKDDKGDIEVGLSLPQIKMDAFASVFTSGLMMYDYEKETCS